DPQTGAGVVDDRRRPCGVERRLGDRVQGPWLAEVEITALTDEAVVGPDRLLEILRRHRNPLVFHLDRLGELAHRAGAEEEPAFDIDVRGFGLPLLALDRRRIEDRPDRAAAVVAVADPGHGGVDPVVGLETYVLGVE